MPIYEYVCTCGNRVEAYRLMKYRDLTAYCAFDMLPMERIYSVPAISIWNADRSFPNVVKSGDGKFPTRSAYEAHLKRHNLAEVKTDGKIKRPHGNKVIARY